MGYNPVFMSDIIALKRRGLLDGCRRVVEIGAQQIDDSLIASTELDERRIVAKRPDDRWARRGSARAARGGCDVVDVQFQILLDTDGDIPRIAAATARRRHSAGARPSLSPYQCGDEPALDQMAMFLKTASTSRQCHHHVPASGNMTTASIVNS